MNQSKKQMSAAINGIDLILRVNPIAFSPRDVDPGALTVFSYVEFTPHSTVPGLVCVQPQWLGHVRKTQP